jgi:hypothetical protein
MFAAANKQTLTLCLRAICRHNDDNEAARAGPTTTTRPREPATQQQRDRESRTHNNNETARAGHTTTARPRACCNQNTRPRAFYNQNNKATGLLQPEQHQSVLKFSLIPREEERTPYVYQDTRLHS